MSHTSQQTKNLLRYFFGAYPRRTAVMVLLMLMAGIVEGLGVVTMIPVLELADASGAPTEGPGALVRSAIEAVGLRPTLTVLLGLIVLSITAKAVFLLLAQREVGFTTAGVVRDLRLQMMRGLLRVRWSYFAQRGPGQFANSVTAEAPRAAHAYQEVCAVIAAMLQMAAYFVVAMLISWWVAAGSLLAAAILGFVARFFFRQSRDSGQEQTAASKSLSQRLVDALQGIKPLKAMGREGLVWPLLAHEAEQLNLAKRKEVVAMHTLKAFQEPILVLMLAIGLFVALELSGQPLSSMLVLAFIFYRLVVHINTLQTRYQYILVGESAFQSFRGDLDEVEGEEEHSGGARTFAGLKEGIRLDSLTFGYGPELIMEEVTLEIPARSWVAIHGESGSGKTTLADLIVGLYAPDSGQVLIDEIPLSEWDLGSWRRSIGYVPQETLLFNESVFLNVTLGDPSFTKEDAERALRLAEAWDFVESKADGLDHQIGERGGMLSGGQRQRIALARALVGRPSLLILDEATAALDPKTEQGICDTLQALTRDVTVLSISHQTLMRESATIVYEMRAGRLEQAVA